MAQALQCPTCGSTTRLDGLEVDGTLQCANCGQVMKAPPGVGRRKRGSSAEPAGAPVAAPSGGSVVASSAGTTPAVAPPAPRRKSRPTMTAGGTAAAGVTVGAGNGGTAVVAPGRERPSEAPPPEPSRPARRRSSTEVPEGRDALPLWVRVAVWVVALPLGLLIVGIPARHFGYLSSQKLLDVIVKHDITRFVPIVVIVALWALVTAVLVTVLVEGGRRWMLHRRSAKPRALGSAA